MQTFILMKNKRTQVMTVSRCHSITAQTLTHIHYRAVIDNDANCFNLSITHSLNTTYDVIYVTALFTDL